MKLALAPFLLAAPLLAQHEIGARSFLPPNYQAEMLIDLTAMRDDGLFDALERSLAYRAGRSELRKQVGIDIADLDTVRMAVRMAGHVAADRSSAANRVLILEGTKDLVLPPPDAGKEAGQVEGTPVLRATLGSAMWALPHPGLLVMGIPEHIESVLRGQQQGGVPHPDLVALTAARKPLIHIAAARAGIDPERWHEQGGFPDSWTDPADPVDSFVFRLAENEDGKLALTMLVRFADKGSGPETFEAGMRDTLSSLVSEAPMKPMAELTERIRYQQRSGELFASLELGTPREAGATLNRALLPALAGVFMLAAGPAPQAQVIAAPARPLAVPAPPAPPAPPVAVEAEKPAEKEKTGEAKKHKEPQHEQEKRAP